MLVTRISASRRSSGTLDPAAPIAQSAERLHGKEKVKGSIPYRGSTPAELHQELRGHRSRRRSTVGEVERLIIVRSRVRVPPPLPHTGRVRPAKTNYNRVRSAPTST